jgi:hypothetical protein
MMSDLIGPEEGEPPPLIAGAFELHGNDLLGLALAESFAQQTGRLERIDVFKRVYSASYSRPTPPDKADPTLYQNPPKTITSPKQLQAWRQWRFENALSSYQESLADYHAKTNAQKRLLSSFSPDQAGYIRYFQSVLSANTAAFFLQRYRLPIAEEDRRKHTYISGGSGSGKTEAIKVLIHHYITRNPSTAVVVLDPHGDLAEQVARFADNSGSDRLVYIDPLLDAKYTPVFNPFDVPRKTPETINVSTEQLIDAFEQLIDSKFSLNMKALLQPCLTTLFLRDGSTLIDLMRFMNEEESQDLLQFAAKNLPNPIQRHFLQNDYFSDGIANTRQAIRTRLQVLLNSHTFLNFTVGKSTFDLEAAIREKKLIIFNLSRGSLGADTSEAIGRFIVAQIRSFHMQQATIPEDKRSATHLFIDECQLYVSKSIEEILTEARKYRLYLTLASQILGQNMDTQLKNILLSNTNIKMTGKNALATLKAISGETGAPLEDLQTLNTGDFHIKAGTRPSVRVKMPGHLLGSKHATNAATWREMVQSQLARYYRPTTPQNAPGGPQGAFHGGPAPEGKRKPKQPIDL